MEDLNNEMKQLLQDEELQEIGKKPFILDYNNALATYNQYSNIDMRMLT